MYKLGDIFYEDEEYSARAEFCNKNGYVITPINDDENGRRYQICEMPLPSDEELKSIKIFELKAELAKIKEDIEQEAFGLVRDDYAEKKARAAEIINELRVLEGKEPREVKNEDD